MAQRSAPWTTVGTGDGPAGGYSFDRWSEIWRVMFNGDRAATGGVVSRYLNALVVTNPGASTIRVGTGAAIVHGTTYVNDAAQDFAFGASGYHLPTTKLMYYVVLRKDWALQTVRPYFIHGSDAASPSAPTLTQTVAATWEIPLASFYVDNAGTITVLTDIRQYALPTMAQRSASKVIAASNASLESRSSADTVCDGTADDAEIQAALDIVAAAGGGVVEITEGTFNCPTGLTIDDSVVLRGTGWGSVLKLPDATNPAGDFAMVQNENAGTGTNERLGVQNLCIDLNQTNNTGNLRGICLEGVSLAYITNVLVYDAKYHAVRLRGACNYITLQGCLLGFGDAVNGVGIGVLDDGAGAYPRFVQLIGNTLDTLAIGIDLQSPHTISLVGNTLTGCDTYGIRLYGAYNCTVAGNTIKDGDGDGILLDNSAAGNAVHGNTVTTVGASGIYVNNSDYNTLGGNIISGPGHHGILLDDASNNIVQGNHVYNASQETDNTWDGIHLVDDSDENHIYGNSCRHAGGANQPQYGVNVSAAACDRNYVHDNDLLSAARTGNLANSGTDSVIRRNRGYKTENSGTAKVLAAATSIVVTHGLAGTPTRVMVTPLASMAGAHWWWADTKTATEFTIHTDTTPGTDVDFDWRAWVGEEDA